MSSANFGSTHPRSSATTNGANPFIGYVKIGVVGRGAYGICCAYKKPRDDDGPPRKVIIKSVPLEGLRSDAKEKVEEEARLLKKLRHPNIINCYGYHIYENALHIVMHYAEGGTLQDLISDQCGKYLPESIIKYYFAQLAQALRFCHKKGVIHRDVKTQNIFMNRKRTLVMLGDFGISKQMNSTAAQASTVIGTPQYFAPEMFKGKLGIMMQKIKTCLGERYNYQSDMWSLGCVLFELVELKRAFDGDFPAIIRGKTKERKHTTSVNLSELITKLLTVNPDSRLKADSKLQQGRQLDDAYSIAGVISHPSILRTCIDIHLDLGRYQSEMEKQIAESLTPMQTHTEQKTSVCRRDSSTLRAASPTLQHSQ